MKLIFVFLRNKNGGQKKNVSAQKTFYQGILFSTINSHRKMVTLKSVAGTYSSIAQLITRADLDIDVTVSRDMYYPNKVFQ